MGVCIRGRVPRVFLILLAPTLYYTNEQDLNGIGNRIRKKNKTERKIFFTCIWMHVTSAGNLDG